MTKNLFVLLAFSLFSVLACKQKSAESGPEKIASENKPDARLPEIPDEIMQHGETVYVQNCLVCHQAGGSGVPGLNPPLRNTDYVTGDKNRLLDILLQGSNTGLVVNGTVYSNAMPGFAALSDSEIASVATYIRNSFGNQSSPVSESEVAASREPAEP